MSRYAWLCALNNYCIYCGQPGARSIVDWGWAHKRCIPSSKQQGKTAWRAIPIGTAMEIVRAALDQRADIAEAETGDKEERT